MKKNFSSILSQNIDYISKIIKILEDAKNTIKKGILNRVRFFCIEDELDLLSILIIPHLQNILNLFGRKLNMIIHIKNFSIPMFND